MELVDIYDQNGNRTGVVKDRSEPLLPGEYVMAVGIWIQNSRGEIFLTKRSPEKWYMPNKWENPAGHVQAGEDCEDAIVREVFEETGVTVQKEQMTFLGGSQSAYGFGRDYGVRMDFDLSVVRLQPGETCDAKWVDYAEFRRMTESGALASSVVEHMEDYMDSFLQFIGQAK
ncbi:MAG: NUDIX domain-containing protein [Clostridia bacterium]|nr:NUDIX domain-containing protein [Clostridia bacterium]